MTDGRNYSTQIRCGEPMDSIRGAYMGKGYFQEVRYMGKGYLQGQRQFTHQNTEEHVLLPPSSYQLPRFSQGFSTFLMLRPFTIQILMAW